MKSSPHLLMPLIVTAVFLATTIETQAQDAEAGGVEQARHHFERAQRYKELEDWDRAVEEYRAAYAHYAAPEFLFNIAEIHRLQGDREQAIETYEAYLDADPNGRGSEAAREALKKLREAIVEEEPETSVPVDSRRGGEDNESRDADRSTTPAPEITDSAAPASRRGKTLRISGLLTAGAGAAALAGGAFFGHRAASISDELSQAQQFDYTRYDAGEAANRRMLVLTGVGAAALTGGIVMYVLGRGAGDERTSPSVVLAPSASFDGFAVTASGGF